MGNNTTKSRRLSDIEKSRERYNNDKDVNAPPTKPATHGILE